MDFQTEYNGTVVVGYESNVPKTDGYWVPDIVPADTDLHGLHLVQQEELHHVQQGGGEEGEDHVHSVRETFLCSEGEGWMPTQPHKDQVKYLYKVSGHHLWPGVLQVRSHGRVRENRGVLGRLPGGE